MKPENERESLADSLAPYVPPASVDESVPLDADGMPLNYRDIAIHIRKVMYKRRVAALIAFFTLFIFAPVSGVLIVLFCEEPSIFGFVLLFGVLIMLSVANSLSDKEIKELKRKSGYSFSWFQPSRPDPVLYAVRLLRRAGYRANCVFLPDMTQFDSVKEDSHEA